MARSDEFLIFSARADRLMRSGNLRRGIASVHLLVGLAAEHGLGAAACLRGSGIRAERLEDPFAEVEAAQELIVVRNIVRHLGRVPGIGLEAGPPLPPWAGRGRGVCRASH